MNLSSPRPRPRPRSRFLHAGARQAAELPVTMTFQTLGNKEFCTNCQDWQSESDILWMMVMLCGFFLHFEYDKISWGNDFGGLFSVELIHLVHSKLVDFNRFWCSPSGGFSRFMSKRVVQPPHQHLCSLRSWNSWCFFSRFPTFHFLYQTMKCTSLVAHYLKKKCLFLFDGDLSVI